MSAWLVLGVGVLGGLGAVARVLVTRAVQRRAASAFPAGTLAINVSGSFALGLLTGLGAGDHLALLAGTGLLGAFTTFSTWMLDTHRASPRLAAANLALPLLLGLASVWLGRALA